MANNNKVGNKKSNSGSSIVAQTGRGMAFFGMISSGFIALLLIVMGFVQLGSGESPEAMGKVHSINVDGDPKKIKFTFSYNGVETVPIRGTVQVPVAVNDSIKIHHPEGRPLDAKVGGAPDPGTVAATLIVIGLVIGISGYAVYKLTQKSNTFASGYAGVSVVSALMD
jgi:hypothetical protein